MYESRKRQRFRPSRQNLLLSPRPVRPQIYRFQVSQPAQLQKTNRNSQENFSECLQTSR